MSENTENECKGNIKSLKRLWSELSTKARIKVFIRLLIIFYCILGLSLQTTQLVIQYTKRQTVVNVQIETIKYNKLPALTICYPRFLSMDRVRQRFPELNETYEEIQNQLKNDPKNGTNISRLIQFYESLIYFVEDSNLSIDEFFELSIPFEFKRNSCLKPIEVKIKGIRLNKNKSFNDFEVWDKEPIESIVFTMGRQGAKCFTFFHHLNKQMTKYQMDVKEISIEMFHKEEWFPINIYNETSMIQFSMHSPTSIPQQLNVHNFLRLKAGKEYEMTYSRWKTILLESPYQTHCWKYNLDNSDGPQMRSDCINNCIQEGLREKCSEFVDNNKDNTTNSTKCFFRSDALRRKDFPTDKSLNITLKLCPQFSEIPKNSNEEQLRTTIDIRGCIDGNVNRLTSECENTCQSECISRFYNYNIKTNIKHDREWYEKGNRLVSITIGHNQLPDQITEHIPEITFTQFAANFGGLLGMWLGISFLALFQFFLKVF